MVAFANRVGANRTVLALSLARLVDALTNGILFVILPLHVAALPGLKAFHLGTPVLVGLLISLHGLVFVVSQFAIGALSDRAARRKPFIQGGLLLLAASTAAFVLARSFVDLLILRLLQGLAIGLVIPTSMALIARSTVRQTRGSSIGIYDTTRMVGLGLGPLIGGLLYVSFGFTAVFLVAAGFAFVSLVLVHVLVRETPAAVAGGLSPPAPMLDPALVNAGSLGLVLAATLMAMIHATLTALENELNLRLQQTALGFGIAFSALIFSRLLIQVPLGRLSDRIGRKPLIVGGLILMAPATVLLVRAETTLQFTLLMVVQGIAMAAIASPAYALAADVARLGQEGQQMGMVTLGFGLGMAVGPFLAGSLAVLAFELPFVVGGLATLFGAWYVRRFVPEAAAPRKDLAAEAP